MTVQDFYNAVDAFAPFATQERWDNSGILVGSPEQAARRALVSLDISPRAVQRAAEDCCDLIIAHHPVIFQPLKSLPRESPVYALARSGMAAICCHTPLDIAEGGINDLLVAKLSRYLCMTGEAEPLDEAGCGRIVTLAHPASLADVASFAKTALGCGVVRCSTETSRRISRLGICSGSGASMLEEIAGTCDALLTGDVKHDRWYKAQELGIELIDCGHYHTERIMVDYVARQIHAALPEAEILPFMEEDPCVYL